MNPSLIHILTNSSPKEISRLYFSYKKAFLNFGKKHKTEADIIIDIYKEAFVVLRKHCIQGKLNQIKGSIKPYLFGIGKTMLSNYQEDSTSPDLQFSSTDSKFVEVELDAPITLSKEQKVLHQFFGTLGERCQEILILFYYRGLAIEEIADRPGYENITVVKNKKLLCTQQLKNLNAGIENEIEFQGNLKRITEDHDSQNFRLLLSDIESKGPIHEKRKKKIKWWYVLVLMLVIITLVYFLKYHTEILKQIT
ncbi:RNA polymerase sigma factor [Aquimarina algiphila]|uniref:RNA polymerase sigma factor n=1 Tax=Aquimarina algiphila TaxID=2047982 RepID=UPI00233077AF|nr:hypothetical protein [Aquimarina algiphila]